MALFGNNRNVQESKIDILENNIKRNPYIEDNNKEYLMSLISRIKTDFKNNPFSTEEEFITFVSTIINNKKLVSYNFENLFKDATQIYKDIRTSGYTFYNAFINMFYENGLYVSGYFSMDMLAVFEYSENYFQIMDIILSNEKYKNSFDDLKGLIIALAVYTPNDLELKTMLSNFLVTYSFNGNIKDAIKEYLVFAKKRAGIYEELDEQYLARIEALVEKAKDVFDLTQKEQDKLMNLRETITASRRDIEKIITTYEEAVKRTDSSINQLTKGYQDRLEQLYFDLFAKLKNDADELLKSLITSSENEAHKLALKALEKIEQDIQELSSVKSKYELTTNEELTKIEKIKNEATLEVKKGLEEIKNIISSSNLSDLEGLDKVKELLANLPKDPQTIIAPSKQVIMTNGIVTPSIDSKPLPQVVTSLDKTLEYKKRYNFVMDKKKSNEQKGVIYHECIEDTIKHILGGRYPYLYGPSGSGKTYTVNQIADLLGITPIEIGYITEEYELIGGRNANGDYSPSTLFECYKYGHLAFADEFDNGVPQATVKLNGIMDSESFPFPVVGFVQRHPNFCLVAAGNTKGTGATSAHNSRSKMDNSILERFQYIKYDYDKRVEKEILKGYSEWLEFVDLYRKAVNSHWHDQEEDIIGQVTTRDIKILADMLKEGVWTDTQILKDQFVEAKEPDYLAHIEKYLSSQSASQKTQKLIKEFRGLI